MKVKSESEVAQPCLTLRDPMDYSPPGSSVHGIFQARVLEWGVIAFSSTNGYRENRASKMALVVKNPPANAGDNNRRGFDPWIGKIPWSRKWQPTLVFFPGKSHGQRSLVGYSPWGHEKSDTTEQLTLKTLWPYFLLQPLIKALASLSLYRQSEAAPHLKSTVP